MNRTDLHIWKITKCNQALSFVVCVCECVTVQVK